MIGIVVGLAAEARLARGLGGSVGIGGGEPAGAEVAATRLAKSGVRGLVSFGLAGGLAPHLGAGSILAPQGVLTLAGERWGVDPALSARLGEVGGWLLAAHDILATRDAKRQAWKTTGAVAVDLESGVVARIAAAYGLPFAALRAVCDPADRDLPPAATTALDAQGRIRPAALLRSLTRYPGQIPALVALGRDAALARRALLKQVERIGRLN